jgi:hypothetical protein
MKRLPDYVARTHQSSKLDETGVCEIILGLLERKSMDSREIMARLIKDGVAPRTPYGITLGGVRVLLYELYTHGFIEPYEDPVHIGWWTEWRIVDVRVRR